jgi:hypothetical protein
LMTMSSAKKARTDPKSAASPVDRAGWLATM